MSVIVVVAVTSGFFIISHFSSAEQNGAIDEYETISATDLETDIAEKEALVVDEEDLVVSGFTDVQPVSLRLPELVPNLYFRVAETVSDTNPEWGAAADLVAVMIRPMSDAAWVYNQGQVETIDYAGRTQLRFSLPGYYIVVTGPDFAKVTSLAQWLGTK